MEITCRDAECDWFAKLVGPVPAEFATDFVKVSLFYVARRDQVRFLVVPVDYPNIEFVPEFRQDGTQEAISVVSREYWWFDLAPMDYNRTRPESPPRVFEAVGKFIRWVTGRVGGKDKLNPGKNGPSSGGTPFVLTCGRWHDD